METKSAKRTAKLLNSSALTRPLILLGAASVFFGTGSAQALDSGALPQDPNVVGGSATFSQGKNTLNVNQSSNRAIIDWRSFNIGSAAQTNFNQPNSSSIAVNRINGSTNPTQIEGGLHANGQVWILNPNGVFFGKTAHVDAAGIVATTANIDDKAFMAGSNTLQMTGADHGSVSNAGNITVGASGLAAFVAPSVRNSGTINATVGKVTLAAGTTYTLDLAGDHLVELGLGGVNAVVDNSGKIVNPGGTIELTAKAASQVVNSVVNVSGVVNASSVSKSGGTIILGGDNVTTTSTAQISADAGTNGNGGSITAVANNQGNYAGTFSAKGGTQSGNGGSIETSGTNALIDNNISVDTSAPNGLLGNWTVDPLDITIVSGNASGTSGSSISVGAIKQALKTTDLTITTNQTGTDHGDLTLQASINANGAGNLTLIARHMTETGSSTINIAGALTLDVNSVNPKANTNGWITDAIDMVGTVGKGTTINVGAGTYNDTLDITKSNIAIEGAGQGQTIIEPTTTLLDTGVGHKYTADMKTTVFVNNASNVTLNGLTINGNDLGNDAVVFWNNSSGSITNSLIENAKTFDGTQTGQGLAVDATSGNTDNLTVSNVTFQNFNKNGIDAETGDGTGANGGNITLNIDNSSFTGAGATGTIAQNGIVLWEQGGGTINATIDTDSFSNLDYTGADSAAGVLVYGSPTGTTTIENSNFAGSVQEYISTAGGAHGVDATNNNTFNGVTVSGTTPLSDLYTIENSIIDGTTDGTDGLVRLVAGHVYATANNDDIQDAITVASAGDIINVQAGTYDNTLDITKNVDIEGAGVGQTIIQPTALLDTGVGHKYTPDMKATVFVNGASDVTLNGLTINGNDLGNDAVVFWNNSSGSITNSLIENAKTFDGTQTGQGLAVDATNGNSDNLTVSNVTIQNFNKNGIDAETGDGTGANGGNITLNVTDSNITGAGATATIAQNGIVLWEQGGGTINATIDGGSFSNLDYTGADSAAGVLQYGSANGTVTVSNSTFTNVQEYISSAGGSTHEIDATDNNTFDGVTVSGTTALSDIYTIENSIIDGTTDGTDGLVRLVAGHVYATANNDDIQDAVTVASAGDIVNVQAGTYTGQVAIDKNLTILGAGAGQTIIDAPDTLATSFTPTGGSAQKAIVSIGGGANVSLSDLTIDGLGKGDLNGNNQFDGIGIYNANATINGVDITGIRDGGVGGSITGAQNGVGVVAYNDDGTTRTITLENSTIEDFQKNATAFHGGNLTVNILDNQLTGAGNTSAIAQNGVEFDGTNGGTVTGNISGNIITGFSYAPATVDAGAILLYNASGTTIENNTITGSGSTGGSMGVYAVTSADLTIQGNSFSNLQYGVDLDPGDSNAKISGGSFQGNYDAIYADSSLTDLSVTGASFSDNDYHFWGADGAVAASVLANNTFDATALLASADNGIYGNLQTAVDDAVSGDTATIAGTFKLGSQLVVDKNISIVGNATSRATIEAGTDFTGDGTSGAMILVDPGVTFGLSNAIVSGTGETVYQGLRNQGGATTIDNVDFNNISGEAGSYEGAAVVSFGGTIAGGMGSDTNGAGGNAASLTVENSTFENIGREGILVKGDQSTATITGNTYTGKGDGDWLDYGIELGAGAQGTITDNTITDATGVASTDGSTSAGIIVTTYYGSGTKATIENNVITGNTVAVDVGFDANDTSTVTAIGNDFAGNGVELESALTNSDFTGNWWGTTNASTILGYMQSYNGDAGLVNFSTYLTSGTNTSASPTGFQGDFSNLDVTTLGGGSNRINEAISEATGGGTINVASGTYAENVSSAKQITFDFGTVTVDSLSLLAGSSGSSLNGNLTASGSLSSAVPVSLNGNFTAASMEFDGAVTLSGDTTLDTSAASGTITVASVTGGGNDLTIDAGTANTSLGNVSGAGKLTVDGTATLTGTSYTANKETFDGAVTLTGDTTLDTSAANGTITVASVTGAGNDLTIDAGTANTSLGSVSGAGALTVDGTSKLTGTSYTATSEAFDGAVTLTGDTTLDTSAANGTISVASVDGTTLGGQSLTINAGTGTVDLGNAGANKRLNVLTDNNTTTLTGSTYNANSVSLGATTLDAATTITTHNGAVNVTSVTGAGNDLTINAGTANTSLGNVSGAGALTVNGTSTLTGNSYTANSEAFDGAVTLTKNTTTFDTSAANGTVTIASIDGTTANAQNLTIRAGSGTVSLGSAGANVALGTVRDNNATDLTGNSYVAGNITFGGITLAKPNTTIDTSGTGGSIVIASADGTTANTQNLTLKAGVGTVSLGDVGDTVALGNLKDENTTTLTGNGYVASSFDFGAVTLTKANTVLNTTTANGAITLASTDGTTANSQNLTLRAGTGTVSLGDVGDTVVLGNLKDENTTTLKGANYTASSIDLGATTLNRNTTVDTSGANGSITFASVDGAAKNLTLKAGTGVVSLGDVGDAGALGNLKDENQTTLTGGNYTAASIDLGATTLNVDATLDTSAAGGAITVASIDGSRPGMQNLTLNAGTGTVSLGDTGTNKRLNALVDSSATTLTGRNYNANSLEFDGAVTLRHGTTMNTSADNGDITLASVDGTTAGAQDLTLKAGTGIVALGDVGNTTALGNLTDENATTLNGGTYNANSIDLGATTLTTDTTLNATTSVTAASIDGAYALTIDGATASLGNLGATTRLGAVVDNAATTLTGSTYDAASLDFTEALTLAADVTLNATGSVTTGSIDGDQALTIDGTSASLGDLGATTRLGAVTDNAATTLTGSTYDAASLDFEDALTLTADTTLDATTSVTTGSIDGADALTINGATASLGDLGATTRLGAVVDNAATTLNGGTYNADSLDFEDAVTLTTDTTLNATTSVTTASVDGAYALTVDAATASLGNLGATTRLGAVVDNAATTLTGSTYDAASLDFEAALTLVADATLDATTSVTTGSIDGDQALTINGASASLGNLGATTRLGAVIDNAATTLNGGTYNAASLDFTAPLTLTTDTTLDATTSVTTASVDGDQALTINGASASLGNLGATTRLGAVIDNAATTLTGNTYNAASLDFAAALTLAADATLDATGSVTTGSVDGAHALTINGASASLGNIGATTRLGAVVDNAATTLTGSTYDAASLDFAAALTLANDVTLNATGTVTTGSIDGAHALTVDATTASLGNLGATTALGAVTDNAATTLAGNTYNASSLDFGGALTLTADTTLDATSVTTGSVDGAHALTVDATTASLGNLGATTALGAVTDNAATTLTGTTYNAASLDFSGPVTLANDVTLNATSVTTGSIDGAHALTVDATTASLGNLGATTALGAVSDDATTTLTGTTYDAASLNFSGPLTLTADTTLDATSVTTGSVDGAHALTVDATTASLGNLGATTALGAVSDNAATTLTGGTYNASSLNFGGAVTLTAGTTLDATGSVTMASVDGAQALTINAASASLGNLGANTRLGAVTDNAPTTLTGTTYNASSMDFGGALTLTANTTLNATGSVTTGSVDGAHALTVDAASASLGNLGATTRLGAVTDNAAATALTGSTYDANSFDFAGNVTLVSATTTLNTTQSSSAAGNIAFGGDIFGTTNGGQSLVLVAGPGTGAASANGNITLQNAGTSSVRLDNLTVSGNNFSGLTLDLAGNYNSTLTGNQVFASDTLNVLGSATSNVAGNSSGHVEAQGNVTFTVGGQLSGTISGENVDLQTGSITDADITGSQSININSGPITDTTLTAPNVDVTATTIDATVVASNEATITADTISGSYSGGDITLLASQNVNAAVNATDFNVTAPLGTVTGTWTNLVTDGSGTLNINGVATVGSGNANPNQLVVEGFVLPAGSSITASGQLILPEGVVLGLLSPGGNKKPKVILVNDVRELGELLAEGYTAIVIDLTGRTKSLPSKLAMN